MSESAARPTTPKTRRIEQLQRNLEFLQVTHCDMLRDLHDQISRLQQSNAELSSKLSSAELNYSATNHLIFDDALDTSFETPFLSSANHLKEYVFNKPKRFLLKKYRAVHPIPMGLPFEVKEKSLKSLNKNTKLAKIG